MRRTVWRFTVRSAPALLLLAAASGCNTHVINGNETVYRMDSWLGPGLLCAGVVAVVAGWLLRSWNARHGYTLLVGGPAIVLLTAPSMFNDHVKVNATHFEASYGLWLAPTTTNVQFDDLRELCIREIKPGGGQDDLAPLLQAHDSLRLKVRYYFDCTSKVGQKTRIDLGSLLEDAAYDILRRAHQRGVWVPQFAQLEEMRPDATSAASGAARTPSRSPGPKPGLPQLPGGPRLYPRS